MAHYLGLYVNYKGTPGLDRMFTLSVEVFYRITQGQWQEWFYVYNSL